MTFQSDAITKLIICGGKLVIAITKLFQETNFLNLVIFTTVEYVQNLEIYERFPKCRPLGFN